MVKGQSIDYDEHEEHILRRLGGAVIVHWDTLAPNVQKMLIEQAAAMSDRDVAVQADFVIGAFIAKHKGER